MHCTIVHTDSGSEMRSPLWLGGVNAEPRRGGKVGAAAVKALQRVRGPDATLAEALVVHCSREMSHPASLLPATYAKLGNHWAFGRTPPRTSFQFASAASRIHGTSSVWAGGRSGSAATPAHGQDL